MNEFETGCGVCGREIHLLVDERGEAWKHTVEPTGHVATPSREAYIGRARMISELRAQLERAMEVGQTMDWQLVENWLEWFARPDAITSREQDNEAYREAMAALK